MVETNHHHHHSWLEQAWYAFALAPTGVGMILVLLVFAAIAFSEM